MASKTLEQELLGLEKEYWRAVRDKDIDAALRLTHDPCVVTGPQGVASIDKRAYTEMAKSQAWTLHDFELKDPQVRVFGDDVAILAYKVHEKMTVEGKPVTLEAADASTWVRRDGRWLCVLHTESIAGDPFGRDRQAST
jgi:uncharacterized protein (TIGR02246 family)